jgi:hypothetical protein
MKLLTSPTSQYLLEASLEVLHEQSREFLKEIDFMKVEISFFSKLLNKNAGKQFPTEQAAALGKRMVKFVGASLPDLRKKILEHERMLSTIIQTNKLGRQETYRQKHRDLTKEVGMTREKFRRLKKKVFSFAKH